MAVSVSFPLSLLLLLLVLSSSSAAKPPRNLRHRLNHHHRSTTKPPQNDKTPPTPTRYFEVTKPVETTPPKKECSVLALRHSFGFTYGKPPVTASYGGPPASCGGGKFSRIVLEWSAASKGRQYDRIFGIWLAGVELLRSCTAEPRATGTVWTVQKDVTRYHSLLTRRDNQTLAVYLGNLVDSTYTGVYHVNLTFHFYPSASAANEWADLVIPVSRSADPPLNDGLWFQIQGSNDSSSRFKDVKIPRNAYRAILEVYVSFHENDEFWYGNFPNVYNEVNNLTSPGNGPFREVLASLDGALVGAVWPFTVVFTGGINPLLWRPITAVGSFDLPSYDIEITPSLGRLLDGENHRIGFRVTNALNVWLVDANLHLWLDRKSARTEGAVLKHAAPPPVFSLESNFSGFDGTFATEVSRSVGSTGWVKSSRGNVTTSFEQSLYYTNKMVLGHEANKQIVDQAIYSNDTTADDHSGGPSSSNRKFSFHMYSDAVEKGNETRYVSSVSLGLYERRRTGSSSESELRNEQSGEGNMVVKDNLVQSGLGSLKQVYDYVGTGLCYFRNISTSNYTIFYDHVRTKCDNGRFAGVRRFWPSRSNKGRLAL